jgi:TIR domain
MDLAPIRLIIVVVLVLIGLFFYLRRPKSIPPPKPGERERSAVDSEQKKHLEVAKPPMATVEKPVVLRKNLKPGETVEDEDGVGVPLASEGNAAKAEENPPETVIDDNIQPTRGASEKLEQPTGQFQPVAPPPQASPGAFGGAPPTTVTPTGGLKADVVHVSAFYPKEVKPADWQPVHAYMFRQYAAGVVIEDAAKQLGARHSEFRTVGRMAAVPVQEGALVVATPNLPGFEFNPPTAQIRFYKDWHRFDFEARAKDAPLNQSANGFITFTVEGIILADVAISIYVGETVSTSAPKPEMTSAKLYQAIFCSYSHQDTTVVKRAERAYKALGLDYLRDVMSLKSGEEWNEELLKLISRADVFQLFWSNAAANSQHVRFEWEHALKLAAERQHFIRPVYWETPTPPIPPELNHIHFAYQPDLAD